MEDCSRAEQGWLITKVAETCQVLGHFFLVVEARDLPGNVATTTVEGEV